MPNTDASGEASMIAAIKHTLETQCIAWNQGDIESLLALYTREANLRYASGGEVLHGFEAVRERFLRQYPDRAAMGHLRLTELEVTLLSTVDALAFGRWRIDRADSHLHGLFTLHLRRDGADWIIRSDHTSSG